MDLSNTQIKCKKHPQMNVRFVCSKQDCEYGNTICEYCLQSEPIHPQNHKNYLFQLSDFLQVQTKMQQKFIPTLGDTFKDVERRFKNYSNYCNNEVQEIDKDFASLFKIFFTISENAKKFMKERVKGDQIEFQNKLKKLKTGFQELAKPKNDKNFFQMIFGNNDDEVNFQKQPHESISKLLERNSDLNEMRSQCIQLAGELEEIINNRISYRKNEQTIQLFSSIREDFDYTCKDMYRRFKGLIEGGNEEDLRKSIFNGEGYQPSEVNTSRLDQSFVSQQSYQTNTSNYNSTNTSISYNTPSKRRQPKTVTIDLQSQNQQGLSRNTSQTSFSNLKESMVNFEQFEKEMCKPVKQLNLKKIDRFPDFKNDKVVQAISKFGSLDLNIQDSYFNNIPDQGPFQYDDGSVYYGHMQNNMRHGRGKFLFQNGAYYEGYWKQDVPFGFGRLIKENGDIYEGQCQNYQAHGKGTYQSLEGHYFYQGEWLEDIKHGKGEEKIEGQYSYKGQFQMDQFHGQGIYKYPDGTVYTGDFKIGKMQGQGTFEYPNGDKFLGEIQNGLKEGSGISVWEDGRQYEGQFKNDLPHGKGLFIWPDGFMYNGLWQNGEQHGKGTEIDPKGKEREGMWKDGEWQRWLQNSNNQQ